MSPEFRKGLLKTFSEFIEKPEARTTDVVANIPIMMCQLYSLVTIDNFKEKYAGDGIIQLEREQLQKLFRFSYEEVMRRNLNRAGKDTILDDDILAILFPTHKTFLDNVLMQKQQQITIEITALLTGNAEEAMLPYKEVAAQFVELDAKAHEEGRRVDEFPPGVLLKKQSSKASGQEENKQALGASVSLVSATS